MSFSFLIMKRSWTYSFCLCEGGFSLFHIINNIPAYIKHVSLFPWAIGRDMCSFAVHINKLSYTLTFSSFLEVLLVSFSFSSPFFWSPLIIEVWLRSSSVTRLQVPRDNEYVCSHSTVPRHLAVQVNAGLHGAYFLNNPVNNCWFHDLGFKTKKVSVYTLL